ncbi:MAG: hypothetical protein DWQ19_08705 [Crenarchaeota archaeon]|nr:MAG: hypothetical protein DWQ19_08705 [Thermoproteota archaeon]
MSAEWPPRYIKRRAEFVGATLINGVVQTKYAFQEYGDETAIPAIAARLTHLDRNDLENLRAVLDEALCVIETGVPSPGV